MTPQLAQVESEVGPYTWDDFLTLPDDDRRELWNGWLVEAEVANALHEHIIFVLAAHLYAWSKIHGGRGFASNYKVKVDARRGFFPDLQYFRAGRLPDPRSAGSEVPPDLVVEVISPDGAGRDRLLKVQAYARRGIPEYWIIDPESRRLERLVLDADGFYQLGESHTGDVPFSPRTFPELTIDLTELWSYEAPAAE